MRIQIFLFILLNNILWSDSKPISNTVIYFTEDEKKAIRREMVDIDIEMRSLSSALTFKDINMIHGILDRFLIAKTSNSPNYEGVADSVYKKFKTKGVNIYIDNVYAIILKMKNEITLNTKDPKKEILYENLEKQFVTMLSNCRLCHQEVLR